MTVQHDQTAILPFLRAAIDAMSPSSIDLKLLASPWSPPAWMKVPRIIDASNGNGTEAEIGVQSMLGSATPNGLIATPNIQSAWANYISLFIEAYYQQGVPIWAITPQNEPEFAAPWEACAYTPQSEADFIKQYLGPTLKTDHPEVLVTHTATSTMH
jgi:glucosylceramidase